MAKSSSQNKILGASILLAGIATAAVLYKYTTKPKSSAKSLPSDDKKNDTPKFSTPSKSIPSEPETPLTSNKSAAPASDNTDASVGEDTTSTDDFMAELHAQIEAIDKRGKKLFKEKKHLDAAEVFTEALDLINSKVTNAAKYNNLNRQLVTLMNNRSAMYEKGGLPDLALVDCDGILDVEPGHAKARTRKLRILETLKRYNEALVEVCALQLKFMQDNRDKLRLGIPVTPPVPQQKIEELMTQILPGVIEQTLADVQKKHGEKERPLPSTHTIMQLIQSFAGYNAWMATAARDGGIDELTTKFNAASTDAEKVEILLKRGRRQAYHRKFEECKADFETAYGMLEKGGDELKSMLDSDVYARVLEWTGMCRHLTYDLDGALKCYEACSDADPTNAEILVKRAGVKMDSGKLEDAIGLFDTALGLDPTAVDALLHRANLRMLEGKPVEAKTDLEKCIELRPNHIFAHLRLATIYMAMDDAAGAKRALDDAERIDSQSSEVHSYRGELYFAQGQMVEAKAEFDRAIECDAGNPTAYVNAALAVMNTPGVGGGPPDIPEAVRLLEKAIDVDPQFHTAYVHLGQLKLSMATDLTTAREVISLYDKGLDYCRTAEELKDIVSMRILTVAQVDAASALKMDTLNMQ